MRKFKEKTTALVAGQPCSGHRTPGSGSRIGRREGKRKREREREGTKGERERGPDRQ